MTTGEPDGLNSRAQGRVGTVLRGKYRLDRVLGVGGMAVVYKATHRNEAEFAVKMLHPELSIHEDIRTRFLREGKAANSVKHPGAVLVVDDDVAEDGAAFLVMELLHGAAVDSLWERAHHRMPVRAVLSVADQLLDVLVAAHARGIVHRDIKPANLFATRDGTLKVLDFGIARVKEAAASQGGGHATGTGMLLGTPAFMAPEQAYAKASEIDGQTDVWAVGATLFTLLSGQFVHQGENAAQLMVHAATRHARPISSVVWDLPPDVAQVIDRALEFEKASRWPSAATMRKAIERVSLEAFGERPSKRFLATLVTPEDPPAPNSVDEHAETAAMPVRANGSPVAPTLPVAPSGPALPTGSTTAQPVSSKSEPRFPGKRGRKARMVSIATAVAVALVGGGVVIRAVRGNRHEPAAAAVGAGPSAATPSELVTAKPPLATATVPAEGKAPDPAGAPPTIEWSALPVALPPALPPNLGLRPPVPPTVPLRAGGNTPTPPFNCDPILGEVDLRCSERAVPLPPAVASGLPAAGVPPNPFVGPPSAMPAAPATAPTTRPNCDPPIWKDDKGHIHLKEGCQ